MAASMSVNMSAGKEQATMESHDTTAGGMQIFVIECLFCFIRFTFASCKISSY